MIQFNSDHAIQLRNSIESFQSIYREEWVDLIQDLQNLQQVWNDTHRFYFDQEFQNLASSHYQIGQELQDHLRAVDRVIEVIGKMKETLPNLDSSAPNTTNSRPHTIPTAASSNQNGTKSSKESNSKLTEQDIQDWQKIWTDISKSVTPFFNKMCAVSTMSLPLFLRAMNSPPVTQVMKLSRQGLTSGIEFIVGDFQDIVDLNNETLGSGWSNLPDESIPKFISKTTEDADNLHFGNGDIADLIGDYADNEEEKRKRLYREQEILNQLRSKYSQQSKRK